MLVRPPPAVMFRLTNLLPPKMPGSNATFFRESVAHLRTQLETVFGGKCIFS
jgi:hypothetical protein